MWVKPSCCDANGCPEVDISADGVRVRSSHRPDEVALLDTGEWADLLAAVKAGEYDLPG